MRRAVLAVVSAAALALVAGCSIGGSPTAAETTGATSTSTGTTGSSGSSEPSGEAPAITGPELDPAKLGGPCGLLTPAQLSARGITKAGAERAAPTGRSCKWQPDDRAFGTTFSATFLTESNGLDGFYENRGDFPVFEPTTVAGYPAVNGDLTDAKSGACSTAVGVAEGDGFVIQINVNDKKLPEYSNPCTASSAIAETVIGNLRG